MSNLAEKDAIRELVAEYCFRLDNDRFADMAALFTSDGTWDTAFGKGTGHAEIEALVRRIRGTGPRPRAIHHVTNLVIKLDGATAKCFSNWVTVQNSDQDRRSARLAATAMTLSSRATHGCSATVRSTVSSTTDIPQGGPVLSGAAADGSSPMKNPSVRRIASRRGSSHSRSCVGCVSCSRSNACSRRHLSCTKVVTLPP